MKKTGRVLILHEDTLVGGIGGELVAWIMENCFAYRCACHALCGPGYANSFQYRPRKKLYGEKQVAWENGKVDRVLKN